MIVRGINVFPSAVENILRSVPEIGEFAVDVYRDHELDDLVVRVEVTAGDPVEVVAGAENAIRNALTLRAKVEAVEFGTLPRFDLKARRFTDHR
jgi:phenylacetate-CoA ligase